MSLIHSGILFILLVIYVSGMFVQAKYLSDFSEPVIWDTVTPENSSTFIAVVAPGLGFDDANEYCNRTFGGRLAVLPDNDTIGAVFSLDIHSRFLLPWIGLRRNAENGSLFDWVNGEPLEDYSVLSPNYLEDTPPCVKFPFNGNLWETGSCGYARSFICEIEDVYMTSSDVVASVVASTLNETQREELVQLVLETTIYYGDYGYTLIGSPHRDFNAAESYCCALNGSLASVLSSLEEQHLLNMTGIFGYTFRHCWIGYYRYQNDLMWTDGSTEEPPSDISGLISDDYYQCFAFNYYAKKWETLGCNTKESFICKFPECAADPTGVNYTGTLSRTINNRTCQLWSVQTPHTHSHGDLGENNYCKNPDEAFTAWCYTTDANVRWEYCAVGDFHPLCRLTPSDPRECYTSVTATDYEGCASVSRYGVTCETSTDGNNLCRNPTNGTEQWYPWCHTATAQGWDFCNVGLPSSSCDVPADQGVCFTTTPSSETTTVTTSRNCNDPLLDLTVPTTTLPTTVLSTSLGQPTSTFVSMTTIAQDDDPNIALDQLLSEASTSEPDIPVVREALTSSYENPSAIDDTGLQATASLIDLLVAPSKTTNSVESYNAENTEFIVTIVSRVLLVNESVLTDQANIDSMTSIRVSLESQMALFQDNDGSNFTQNSETMSVNALKIPKIAGKRADGLLLECKQASSTDSSSTNSQLITSVNHANDVPSEQSAGASVLLPVSIWNAATENVSHTPVTFIAYANDALFPSTISQDQKQFGGLIVSAVVEGAGENVDTAAQSDPVVVSFLGGNDANTSPWSRSCVFWQDRSKAWSTSGLLLAPSGSQSTVCQSTHLTSFAVILDVGIEKSSRVLDIITTIGCILSIILLVITIASFLLARNLKIRPAHKILLNLSAALIGVYACLLGVESVQRVAGCVAVGALGHYFLLAAHAWMTVEAVNMYLMFVKVFDAKTGHMMLKGCLFAWGFPCIVVIIITAVDYNLYRGAYSCYLTPGIAKYVTIHAVVGSLLVINIVIFILILYKLSKNRSNMAATGRGDGSSAAEMARRLQTAFSISCLLGITWIFGFFMHGGAWFVFALFFCLNAYQGVFVFLLFCARQAEIRAFWWGLLHCEWVSAKPKGYPSSAASGQTNVRTRTSNVEMKA